MDSLGTRASWTLAGAVVISWAFLLYGYSDSYPWLAYLEVLVGFFGLGVVSVAWLHNGDSFPRNFGWIALGVSIFVFLLWCWIQVRIAPNYGTDEAAFDQYAAQLIQHGHNPYAISMAKSFGIFHVSPDGYTFRLNGTPVTTLSYPALSFLLYVPFLIIGWSSQLAIGINVIAWAVGIGIAFWLLPKAMKPLALVLGALGVYTGFAVGGVTDALYVPFLIVAVYQWDKFGERHGWRKWVSPTAMGLAVAIKQTPWIVMAFLIVGLYLHATYNKESVSKARNVAGGYLWRVLVIFFIPNIVFIVLNPSDWLRGVLTPIFGDAVPAGQGWIALSNFLGVGGSTVHLYAFLELTVLLLSLVAFVVFYPRTKALAILLPSVILFFSERSFASYLVMLLLPTLVAACSIRLETPQRIPVTQYIWGSTIRRTIVIGSWGLFGIALLATLLFEQPLGIRIQSVTTTGQLATVVDATVNVINNTGSAIRPIFSSEGGGAITAPWNITTGPKSLAANSSSTYVIQAPNFFAQPSLSSGFQIVALTTSPAAMSVSDTYTPTNWHVNLNPEAINKPVAIGLPTTFQAQVLNSTNNAVDRAGIPVYLGQVSYTQHGLIFSTAVINKGQIGQTPIEARTNKLGVATFVITGTQASTNPVYFEANLINSQASYPYGYSDIVPIRFESPKS